MDMFSKCDRIRLIAIIKMLKRSLKEEDILVICKNPSVDCHQILAFQETDPRKPHLAYFHCLVLIFQGRAVDEENRQSILVLVEHKVNQLPLFQIHHVFVDHKDVSFQGTVPLEGIETVVIPV
jgi:hypothetical protein